MTNAQSGIQTYLAPGKRVHLVGIGGVSMRPLGLVLRDMGVEITGSDMNASVFTEDLMKNGIPVRYVPEENYEKYTTERMNFNEIQF